MPHTLVHHTYQVKAWVKRRNQVPVEVLSARACGYVCARVCLVLRLLVYTVVGGGDARFLNGDTHALNCSAGQG